MTTSPEKPVPTTDPAEPECDGVHNLHCPTRLIWQNDCTHTPQPVRPFPCGDCGGDHDMADHFPD